VSKKRCIELPKVSAPEIPLGLSLAPPSIPGGEVNLELCCKLPPIPIPPIPIPLDPIALSTVLEVLADAVAKVNDYINSLPLSCPLE